MKVTAFNTVIRSPLARAARRAALLSASGAGLLGTILAQAQPVTIAGDPTLPQSQVVSLFTSGDIYSPVPGVNFYETWWGGQWTGWGDYPITLASTTRYVKGYQGLLFTGVGFEGSPTNVAGCAFLHVDVYTPNGNQFAVRMVDKLGHQGDVIYNATGGVIVPNTWVHLDIPMNQFTAAQPLLNLQNIQQMGWIINEPNAGISPADYYIDNVYFYSSTNLVFTPPAVIPTPTNNAPTPTRPEGAVMAMFDSSGAYVPWPGVGGVNWRANWSGSAESSFNIPSGNPVMYLPGLSYVGVEFYDPNQIDTTGYSALHFDVWSLDANQIAVQLVSLNPTIAPQIYASISATQTWVGIDIPLSQFSTANPAVVLSDIQQLLWVDNSGSGVQNGTFYIDNVYFWTTNSINSSIALGAQVSWTAASAADSYQPQRSANNSTWSNWGPALSGNAVTSRFDSTRAPFYRVLDTSSALPNLVLNPSFETPAANNSGAANWSCDPNGPHQSVWVTNSFGALSSTTGTNLLYMEGTTPASGAVTPPNCYLQSDSFPVTGGVPYAIGFKAANPVHVGGANPQYRISYFNSGGGYISDSGFLSFASAGSAWTGFKTTNTAPANAASAQLLFIQAVGAGNGWDWVTLIDDVAVVNSAASPVSSTNVLSATVQAAAGITWHSGVGLTYSVQSTPTLTPPVWSAVGANVVGTGTNTVPVPLTGSQNFYRVLEDY